MKREYTVYMTLYEDEQICHVNVPALEYEFDVVPEEWSNSAMMSAVMEELEAVSAVMALSDELPEDSPKSPPEGYTYAAKVEIDTEEFMTRCEVRRINLDP